MQPRDFVKLFGGMAASWPLVARAQQLAMPVIGLLSSASPKDYAPMIAAFWKSLGEAGYVEGQNVSVEYLWADDQYDRLPALAADVSAPGKRDCYGNHSGGTCRKVRHQNDTDRLRDWGRSRSYGTCR